MKFLILAALLAPAVSFAQGGAGHPCEQVVKACESAGFVKGQAKAGTGLWKDCIDPIMQGGAQPAKATKALPTVDPSVVAACKAKKPNFGEGKQK